MDWTTYFNGSWIFPLFCLVFMAVMMVMCFGMRFFGHRRSGGGCCASTEARTEQSGPSTRQAKGLG